MHTSAMSVLHPDSKNIEEIALLKNISAQFVEKDWYLTKAIEIISKINYENYQFIFTGGTALSKAYKLLQRFSEDGDFKLIIAKKNPFANRKKLSKLRNNLVLDIKKSPFFYIENETNIKTGDNNRYIKIDLNYNSCYPHTNSPHRPYVQLEIVTRDYRKNPKICSISSIINEVMNLPNEVPSIPCIDPLESAADKLSALSWRIIDKNLINNNVKIKERDRSLMRHLYDLYQLKDIIYSANDFKDLVDFSAEEDKSKSCLQLQQIDIKDKLFKLIEILQNDSSYKNDYKKFVLGFVVRPTKVISC